MFQNQSRLSALLRSRLALRLQAIGQPNYRNGFKVTLYPQTLEIPLGWKSPRTIFVNSMGDLFHREVPLRFIQGVFATMREHTGTAFRYSLRGQSAKKASMLNLNGR